MAEVQLVPSLGCLPAGILGAWHSQLAGAAVVGGVLLLLLLLLWQLLAVAVAASLRLGLAAARR
jgi:hypothetical protein